MISVWDRLTDQLKEKYVISQEKAKTMARDILIKRGHLDEDGNLTSEGIERSQMTPAERALDRAVKSSGGTPADYIYDEETNTTRKV